MTGLEALERYHRLDVLVEDGNDLILKDDEEYKILKRALQHLEFIDNAKPSRALKCLEEIGVIETYHRYDGTLLKDSIFFKEEYNLIKQTLLKAQEQEKVLEILKKTKNIKTSFYENGSGKHYKLEFDRTKNQTITQEEYDLLKRYFK